MKNEAEFKTAFKKSVTKQKGYSISLAAPMISGIPDLYVIMPGFVPLLLEAKWFGEVSSTFIRKIPYTKAQLFMLQNVHRVGPGTAFGLIGYKLDGKYYATLVDPIYESCTYHQQSVIYAEKAFDVLKLLRYNGVPVLTYPEGYSDKST